MRWSRMLIPTLRQSPKDVDQVAAIFGRAGYAFVSGGRLTALLPLGVACLDKLKQHLTVNLLARGAEEITPLFRPRPDVLGSSASHTESPSQARRASSATDVDGLLREIAARHIHSYNQLPRLWFCSTPHSCEHAGCFIHGMYLSHCGATREAPTDPVHQVVSELASMLELPVIRASGLPVIGREEAVTEFLCLSPDGDAHVARCSCHYAANLDCAVSKMPDPPDRTSVSGEPRLVETPGMKTIADVSDYLGIAPSSLIKSLVYLASGRPVLVLVRGDDQLNEYHLQRALGSRDLRPANAEEIRQTLGADPGSIGPVNVRHIRILADSAIRSCHNMASGANKDDYHLTGVQPERDFCAEYVHLRQVRAGDACPECAQPLAVCRSRLLLRSATLLAQCEGLAPLQVLGPDNQSQPVLISSHRVDLYALLLSALERCFDEDGLVLPPLIAPFDVLITPVKYDDAAQKAVCDRAYGSLRKASVRVLIDDRDVSPGVKFKDADWIGIPLRITVGPKKLSEGKVELRLRATRETFDCPIEDIAQRAVRTLRLGKPTQPVL